LDLSSSSINKGETLQDTIRCVDQYADVIVLRHPKVEALKESTAVAHHPILNAGNGVGEHPTQSLLDLLTIKSELGAIDGKVIVLVGDLKHGRTVHSLVQSLVKYSIAKLVLVAPAGLEMPEYVTSIITKAGVTLEQSAGLTDAIVAEADVLYITRIQKERFASEEDYLRSKGSYVVNKKLMEKAKEKMIVMHPLPRVDEISTDFDEDPRAAYFREMRYGLYLRMALLASVLGKAAAFA